jgi:hypothetical protein
MRLTKHHGLGNDFLVLLDVAGEQPAIADLAPPVWKGRHPGGAVRVARHVAPAVGRAHGW